MSLSALDRARLAYQTIDAFGWDISWKHDKPIPDDAWPIDIIAKHIREAVIEAFIEALPPCVEPGEGNPKIMSAQMLWSPLDALIDALPAVRKAAKAKPGDSALTVNARMADIFRPIVIRIWNEAQAAQTDRERL